LRFKTLANFALASAATLLISGCADDSPRQLYYWDDAYTGSVYEYLSEEGDAGAQIAALEESLQKAYQRAAKAPPGLHAHLGLLYLSQGNGAKFKAYVEKEAQLYPESRDYAMFLLNQNSKTKGAAVNSGAKDADAGKFDSTPNGGKFSAKGSNLSGEAGLNKNESGPNLGPDLNKAAGKTEANLSEQTKEISGASEPNLKGKGSNLDKQISNQNLKNKQTKPAKASKTAKGSQNEK